MNRTLVFDTETTDLVSNSLLRESQQPHIIEFYGQIIDENGQQVEELEFLCHPGFEIEPITTKITGIKREDLKGQPKFGHWADKVIGLIQRADSVVAHNLSYDWFVVNTEFKRLGINPEWPPIRICTVQETEWIKGHRLSLSALHEELFGEPFSGAHRARVDVDALTRCFNELRQRGDI